MAKFYTKRGIYYAWGILPSGQRWARTTRSREYREAQRRGRVIEREVLSAPDLSASQSQSLDAAFASLLEARRVGDSKPGTLRVMTLRSGHVLRILGQGLDIAKLAPANGGENLVRTYIAARVAETAKRSTVFAEVGTLKQALTNAARAGLWKGVTRDFKFAELAGANVPRSSWLLPEQVRRLTPEVLPQWRDHFETYLHTGVRRMELYAITADFLDLEGNRVFIDGTKTKKAKRWLPLTERARAILERRAAEHPTGPLFNEWTNALHTLKTACERAKVPRCTVTNLRRTFASALLNAGVTSSVLKELLGHTTTKQIDLVYGQISDAAKQSAVALLPGGSRAEARVRRPVAPLAPSATHPIAISPQNASSRNTSGSHASDAFRALLVDFVLPVAGR